MQIKKRDSRIKPFDFSRIVNAIEMARNDIYGNDENTVAIDHILDDVKCKLGEYKKDVIEIEKVQDIILSVLYKHDRKIHKAYKQYREERNLAREKNSKKEKFYTEVLMCTNTDNDNANVNQNSFSGRKYRIADNEQKLYALRNLISKEGKQAFEDGLIYYHDLSSYAIGEHNCLFARISHLLNNGFSTRNGDVRPANSFSTACQLVAVIFQIQSQNQFGGVASCGIDWELEPFVHKSFVKHFKEGLYEKLDFTDEQIESISDEIHIDSEEIKRKYALAYDYAIRRLEKEGNQSAQGLYHNLNTLESRAGSQVPFTSINLGRNVSTYGKLINKWLLNASIKGIGKHNSTSIFPIGIFQYKKGVNDKEGTPNYNLKLKAIESMCKRIYPNWVNGDWKQNIEDENDYTTFMATMGKQLLLM